MQDLLREAYKNGKLHWQLTGCQTTILKTWIWKMHKKFEITTWQEMEQTQLSAFSTQFCI